MLTVRDSSLILGVLRERKRTVRLLLAVTNGGSEVFSESRLTLKLRDAHGHLMAEMTLEGGPVSPGGSSGLSNSGVRSMPSTDGSMRADKLGAANPTSVR